MKWKNNISLHIWETIGDTNFQAVIVLGVVFHSI